MSLIFVGFQELLLISTVERITVVFMELIHTKIQTDYNINLLNKNPHIS